MRRLFSGAGFFLGLVPRPAGWELACLLAWLVGWLAGLLAASPASPASLGMLAGVELGSAKG